MRKTLLFLSAVIVWLIMLPVGAQAADDPVDPTDSIASLRLSAISVMFIVSALIPILNGLITKWTLRSVYKAVITLVMNAVGALLVTSTLSDGTAVISQTSFITWVMGLVVSIASYLGVYKTANLTSSSTGGVLLPNFGIGPTVAADTPSG